LYVIADELCSRDSNKIMSSHSLIDRSLSGVFDSSHLVVVTEASFKGGLMANCNEEAGQRGSRWAVVFESRSFSHSK